MPSVYFVSSTIFYDMALYTVTKYLLCIYTKCCIENHEVYRNVLTGSSYYKKWYSLKIFIVKYIPKI